MVVEEPLLFRPCPLSQPRAESRDGGGVLHGVGDELRGAARLVAAGGVREAGPPQVDLRHVAVGTQPDAERGARVARIDEVARPVTRPGGTAVAPRGQTVHQLRAEDDEHLVGAVRAMAMEPAEIHPRRGARPDRVPRVRADVGVVVDLGDERGAREPAAGEPEPQREFLAEVVRAAGEGRVQEAHVAAGRGLARGGGGGAVEEEDHLDPRTPAALVLGRGLTHAADPRLALRLPQRRMPIGAQHAHHAELPFLVRARRDRESEQERCVGRRRSPHRRLRTIVYIRGNPPRDLRLILLYFYFKRGTGQAD